MTRWTLVALSVFLCAAGAPQDSNTALVRTYPHEDELRNKAEKLAAEGRYTEALKIYERAMNEHGSHVIRVEKDLYVSVRQWCMDRIAAWPPEGRAAYRQMYDSDAKILFQRARQSNDKEQLLSLIRQYPYSSFASEARRLLGVLYLEEGNWERAAAALETAEDPASIAARAVALSRLGERARLEKLRASAPEGEILIEGRRVGLRDFVEGCLKECRPPPPRARLSLAETSWPMYGGDPGSTRVCRDNPVPGAKIWSAALPPAQFVFAERGAGWDEDEGAYVAQTYPYNPIVPAVADGVVYVHNEYGAYAYNLFGDSAELLWSYSHHPPAGDLMFEERTVHATTVHDGRVYANLVTSILGSEMRLGYLPVKYPFPKRALFCFDAYTGRLLWRLGGEAGEAEFDRMISFALPPTPVGDRLYVAAVKQRLPQELFEHYVLCLDAATGRILWKTFVATGGTEINLFGNSVRESQGSKVAVLGDDLFYGTNLGVIVCLDRVSGDIKWITRYQQVPIRPTRSVTPRRNPFTWINNPVVATRDALIVTPCDSTLLYAIDPRNGRILYTLDGRQHEVNAVYGVNENHLVLGGSEVKVFDLRTGRLLASMASRRGVRGVGMGTLSSKYVYFPTVAGLSVLDLATRQEVYFQAWSLKGGANVVVADHALVAAGGDRLVEVYFDRIDETETRRELERRPDDPETVHRCALRLLQSRNLEAAVKALERVIELTEKLGTNEAQRMQSSACRRLFLLHVRRARQALQAHSWPEAERSFALAARFALTPGEQVDVLFQQADLYRRRNDPARLVDTLQQLLATHPDAPYADGRVFDVARAQIEEVLRANREPYAKYDQAAQKLYEAAHDRASAEELAAVASKYPNSRIAPRALFEAAELFVKTRRFDDAWKVLRTLSRDYPGQEPQANLLLVRVLEEKKLFVTAHKLLLRLRQEKGELGAFARARLEREEYRNIGRTDAVAPLKPPLSSVLTYVDREAPADPLVPIFGRPQGKAVELVAAPFGPRLRLLNKDGLAGSVALQSTLRRLFWAGERLIVCCDFHVQAVDPTGRVVWTHSATRPMKAFEIGEDSLGVLADSSKDRSALYSISLESGDVVWRTEGILGSAREMHFVDGDFVLKTQAPERLYVVAGENGAVKLSRALVDQDQLEVLYAGRDVVVMYSPREFYVDVYERPSGRFKWRREIAPRDALCAANDRWLTVVSARQLQVVNVKSGKLTAVKDLAFRGLRCIQVEEDHAYVLDAEKLYAFRVGEPVWQTALDGSEMATRSLALTPEHLVVFSDEMEQNARWRAPRFLFRIFVVEKTGRLVQTLTSEARFENPSSFCVVDGKIMVSADNRLEVFK